MADLSGQFAPENYNRILAALLMKQGMDNSPIQSWTQGAARLAQALVGARYADLDRQQQAEGNKWMLGIPGALSGQPTPDVTSRIGGNSGPVTPPLAQPSSAPDLAPAIQRVAAENGWNMPNSTFTPENVQRLVQQESAGQNSPPNKGGYAGYFQMKPAEFGMTPQDFAKMSQEDQLKLYATKYLPKYGYNGTQDLGVMNAAPSFANAPDNTVAYPAASIEARSNPQWQKYSNANGNVTVGGIKAWAQAGGAVSPITGPQAVQPPGTPAMQGQPVQIAGGTSPVPSFIQQGLQSQNPYVQQRAAALANLMMTKQLGQQPEYTRLNDEQILEKHSGRVSGAGVGYRPLVDPAERAQYGIPPTDNRPYQLAPGNKLVNPPPENRVNIDQRAQNEFEKVYGGKLGEKAAAVLDTADKAGADIQRVQLLRGLLSGIQQGKLTPAQATIGGWMQSVGIDPKIVGTDAALPATAEAATAIMNRFALSNIGAQEGGIPANNFSEADRDFILKLVPNLKNRPEANDIILTAKEREARLAIQKADEWGAAREQGTSYEKFDRQWRNKLASQNVFGDLADKVKVLSAPGYTPQVTQPGTAVPNIDDLVKKYGR